MKLIKAIFTILLMLKRCNTQYDFSQYYNQQQQSNFAYQAMPPDNYIGNGPQISPYTMNNAMNSYNYQTQVCDCDCNKCQIPRPCCMEYCAKCTQANPSYYYYPYPYLVVANSQTSTSTTTVQTTTTTEAPTTTTAPTTTNAPTTEATTTMVSMATAQDAVLQLLINKTSRSELLTRDNLLKELIYNPPEQKQDNGNIIVTAMRRTKPRWMPKYGIVPIPDQIAEKLMLRIRQMKVLHPEMDTMRRTDSMYP